MNKENQKAEGNKTEEGKKEASKNRLFTVAMAVLVLLIGIFSGHILVTGAGLLFLGTSLLIIFLEKRNAGFSSLLAAIVYCFLFGAALMITGVIEMDSEETSLYSSYVGTIGAGLFFLGAGVIRIIKKLHLSIKVEGTFLGANRRQSGNTVVYMPRFSYRFEDNDYETVSDEYYSYKSVYRRYEVGKSYPIHISPKEPARFRTRGAAGWIDVLFLVIGLVLGILPFLA